jgi:hypothetical protein
MRQIYEVLRHLFESKAFVTTGTLSSLTIGTFLFGGGAHIELVEFTVKLIATVTTGFLGGCAGQLGKHIADNIKNKRQQNAKRQKRKDNRAA